MIPAGRIAWGIALAASACLEVYGISSPGNDDTLSEFTRWAFQVDHPVGRLVFGLGWSVFALWFLKHILTDPRASSSSSSSSGRDS